MSHTKDKPNNTALNKDLAPTSIVQDRPRAVVVDDKERAIVEKIEQDKSIQKTPFKVAIVTDDGETISRHFGRAKYFAVLTVDNGIITGREMREKPAHKGNHGHGHHQHAKSASNVQILDDHDHSDHDHEHGHGDHHRMFELLPDVQVALTRGMGRGAYNHLQERNIEGIITEIANVDDAVMAYANGTIVNHLHKLH
jgi:predicted Fe-Mo cluster-binding NifX family protein